MGAIESLVDSPRGRWKGSCLVRLRRSRIWPALLLEIRSSQCRCVKDTHPIVFALPGFALWRQYGGEIWKSYRKCRGDLMLVVVAAGERFIYCSCGEQSNRNSL